MYANTTCIMKLHEAMYATIGVGRVAARVTCIKNSSHFAHSHRKCTIVTARKLSVQVLCYIGNIETF